MFKPEKRGGERLRDESQYGNLISRLPNKAIAFGAALAMTVTLAACTGNAREDSAARPEQAATTPAVPEISPPAITTPAPAETDGEFVATPTWEQDFTQQTALDPAVWRYEDNPEVPTWNDELQAYTSRPENVRIEQGTGLVIEARREPYQYPGDPSGRNWDYTSGRIETRPGYTAGLGRIEATMMLPEGMGVWPAFWLLSSNQPFTTPLNPTDADWAQPRFYLHDGELDIMEYYGNMPGIVELTAHTFEQTDEGVTELSDATTAFHTYGVDILEDRLVWRIDGEVVHTFMKPSDNPDQWPFQPENEQKVLLNLAMGGAAGNPDPADTKWQLIVKNVKYFKLQNQ